MTRSFKCLLGSVLALFALNSWAQPVATDQFSTTEPLFDALMLKAEKGEPAAEVGLGLRFRDADGVPRDLAESVNWFRKAAAQGNASGQAWLANAYFNGDGVKQDFATVVRLRRTMADKGDATSEWILGLCDEGAYGVKQDLAEAVKWYAKAADQGLAYAEFCLALCYRHGWGVTQNETEADKWLGRTANSADPLLKEFRHISSGARGNEFAEAIKWRRWAAEQGNAKAQDSLGVAFLYGSGSYVEAVKWFRQAAMRGEVGGAIHLAEYYCNEWWTTRGGPPKDVPVDVPLDNAEAMKWLRAAANQGDHDGEVLLSLGRSQRTMAFIPRNTVEACMWYIILRVRDNPPSRSIAQDSPPGTSTDFIPDKPTNSTISQSTYDEALRLAAAFKPTPELQQAEVPAPTKPNALHR